LTIQGGGIFLSHNPGQGACAAVLGCYAPAFQAAKHHGIKSVQQRESVRHFHKEINFFHDMPGA